MSDELTQLRSANPVPVPTISQRDAERLLADVVARRSPNRHWGQRVGVSLGTVAAVTCLALGLDALTVAGQPAGASAAAVDVLTSTAAQLRLHPDPVLVPGQYLRRTTVARFWEEGWVSTTDRDVSILSRARLTVWVPGDPDSDWLKRERRRTIDVAPTGLRPALAAGRIEGWKPPAGVTAAASGRFQGGSVLHDPRSDYLRSLPRDPQALLAFLYAEQHGRGNSDDGQVFQAISEILSAGAAPSDLRAALLEAASRIPGVDVVDRSATLSGRTGVALAHVEAFASSSVRSEFIVDPISGQFIGARDVALKPSLQQSHPRVVLPTGTVLSSMATTTEVVTHAPTASRHEDYDPRQP